MCVCTINQFLSSNFTSPTENVTQYIKCATEIRMDGCWKYQHKIILPSGKEVKLCFYVVLSDIICCYVSNASSDHCYNVTVRMLGYSWHQFQSDWFDSLNPCCLWADVSRRWQTGSWVLYVEHGLRQQFIRYCISYRQAEYISRWAVTLLPSGSKDLCNSVI